MATSNRPWSRRDDHLSWALMYRTGMTYSAIARAVGVHPSTARDQVASYFDRNGFMSWRRCPRATR